MRDKKSSESGQPDDRTRPGGTSPPFRILVVDDDDSMREMNKFVLIQSGYEVDAVTDGSAAWQALNGDTYDLLVTDNAMPNVTGVELLKKVYAARMPLPVVMATGIMPEEEFARHPWIKPAAMLIKPYTIEEFLETVRQVLDASDEAGMDPELPEDRERRSSADNWQ